MSPNRFTQLYRPKPAVKGVDSVRARKRFARLLWDLHGMAYSGAELWNLIAGSLQRELGIDVPSDYGSYDLTTFVEKCSIDDFLDTISLVYAVICAHTMRQRFEAVYLPFVTRIFDEENLAYRIDEAGMVHYRVHKEHEATVVSALEALSPAKFKAARDAFDERGKTCTRPSRMFSTLREVYLSRPNHCLRRLLKAAGA